MKKILAGLTAFITVFSLAAPTAQMLTDWGIVAPTEFVASADSSYTYMDNAKYTTTMNLVNVSDDRGNDISTWTENNKMVYGVFEVVISHEVASVDGTTTVEDEKFYRVGVYKCGSTDLEAVPCKEVTIPAAVSSYLAEQGYSVVDPTHATVIGGEAYKGTNIKTIDLTGIEYIGNNAFSSCPYITSVTIPDNVLAMGDGVFADSGLKDIVFNNFFTKVPKSVCSNTKVSLVKFTNVSYITEIGSSAFANCILTDYPADLVKSKNPIIIGESAFEGNAQIKSLTIPDNVLRLDASAFSGCTGLKTLKLGANLVSMDKQSFEGCAALTDITFNNKLSSIGGSAFNGCTSLVEVKGLPETLVDWVEVTSSEGYGFGNAIFANCTSLKSITLPDSLTKIPEQLCYGDTSLTRTTIGKGINTVCNEAFSGCTNLQTLNTSKSQIKYIEESAFSGCSSLRELVSTNCESVEAYAYKGCTSLLNVNLTSNSFGEGVFEDCSKIETAKISFGDSNETTIPKSMFKNCSAMTSIEFGKQDTVSITVVNDAAFSGCSSLKKFDLPFVKIYGDEAFMDCTALSKVGMEEEISATDIGDNCFENCTSLSQPVNSKVSTVGDSAFRNSGITSLVISGTVGNTVVYGDYAFADCKNLESADITIEDGVEYSVGSYLFANDAKLKDVKFTGSEIVEGMFQECSALSSVTAKKAAIVRAGAFKNCTSLTGLDNKFSLIESDAFNGCTDLKEIPADASTSFTGESNFASCSSLTSVEVPELCAGMFSECKDLKSVKFLNPIKVLPENVFVNCSSLSKIDSLDSVVEFGNMCLSGTAIKSLKITEANSIGDEAFLYCPYLTSLELEATEIGSGAFRDCTKLRTAKITANSIGSSAFKGCIQLNDVDIRNLTGHSLQNINTDAFYNCSMLREIVVPDSITSMDGCGVGFDDNGALPDFLLVGKKGTAAEEYATNYGLTFSDEAHYSKADRVKARKKIGDVNADGLCSISDAVLLQSWLLNANEAGVYGDNMDMNGDEVVNVIDLALLRQKLLEENK